jgi:hypothetical protein
VLATVGVRMPAQGEEQMYSELCLLHPEASVQAVLAVRAPLRRRLRATALHRGIEDGKTRVRRTLSLADAGADREREKMRDGGLDILS